MNITSLALARPRFTIVMVVSLVLIGLWLMMDFPSSEEPPVTIRTATVLTLMPGAKAERVEQLVVRPTEESIESIPEVKRVKTSIRPGFAFSYVEIDPAVPAARLPDIWQRLRTRMNDLRPSFPEGTLGPVVDDEFGRVAVLTLGLTGEGYTAGELRLQARRLRDNLVRFPGVERVTLHGVREERMQVLLDIPQLAARGVSPAVVAQSVAKQNVVLSAGYVEAGGSEIALDVTGDASGLDAIRNIPIALPTGGTIRLGEIARVERVTEDPPMTGAFVNGGSAIVVAVSMDPGLNVVSFADALRGKVQQLERTLPAGMALTPITDQAQIVTKQLHQVGHVFLETTLIVMGVVVLFLGFRTGFIVGAIVPTTVLGTLTVMRLIGIDLHIISIGAIIIALGIFVDNAIVVAEDMERRLAQGESKDNAAAEAGRSMGGPLLVCSLAIILTFMPLVLSKTDTGEYLSSLGLVMAITLLLSLLLAVSFTPLLCRRFASHHSEAGRIATAVQKLTDWYRGKVRWVLGHKTLFIGAMACLLAGAAFLFSRIPSELMPASERRQLQMAIELAPGASAAATMSKAEAISRYLADPKAFPAIDRHAVYVGDGGPRFILALNPPTPASHRAYAVLSLAPDVTHAEAIDQLRDRLQARFPDVRFEPKRFSMGSSDSGVAVFRLTADDPQKRDAAAQRVNAALLEIPGIVDVQSDAERAILRFDMQVDQVKARAAGVGSEEVARSLQVMLGGEPISVLREADATLPIIIRGATALRADASALAALPIQKADLSGSVPLGQVATLVLKSQPSVIQHYNQERTVTISAKHPSMTAQDIADRIKPALDEVSKDGAVNVDLGGEIEENASANTAIAGLLPVCVMAMFLIFMWQFESVRKSLIILASIPFVSIGAALALAISGTTLTFVGTLGLLALAGIIVNNAVLLLSAIEEARQSGMPGLEAIESAAAKRLRPILMTTMVCVLGLIPLLLFGGIVWKSLSVVMIGGLALGSLITLGLIPALYASLYRIPATRA